MTEKLQSLLDRFTRSGTPVKDLSRFKRLCSLFGDPQDELRYVHVAGTNGKGSTVRMIASSCINAGLRTGEFTSPYIITYNDRIRINNENIPDDRLEELAERVSHKTDPADGYSQFEISNIIAFLYFKEEKTDIVVLEAGLGGLLDSTNVIRDNICSVMTSISLDHMAVLGDTPEKIAAQKAGIIKPGCPVVISPQNTESVAEVISRYAEKNNSPVIFPNTESVSGLWFEDEGDRYGGFVYEKVGYDLSMPGHHQLYNALTAIEAVKLLQRRFPQISEYDRVEGISKAKLPCRLEIHKGEPDIIIDGAHNPDAMKKLSEYISGYTGRKIVMICGMSGTKDYLAALSHISPFIDNALCIDDFTSGTVPAEKLIPLFKNAVKATSADAVEKARVMAGKDGIVLIAGSLYLRSLYKKEL